MGQAADVAHKKMAAFNAQDAGRLMALLGPDVEWAVAGGLLRGGDQVIAFCSVLWEAFPDIELTITRVVEEGSAVAIQGRAEGTHKGTFHTPGGDIPPTDRPVNLTFSQDFEVQGGVIVAVRHHFDRLELLEQLGAMPAPAPA
jgi:predicted ester cyclase